MLFGHWLYFCLDSMIQICRLWNLSILSVLALTISNIILTVRLLHNSGCSILSIDDGKDVTSTTETEEFPIYNKIHIANNIHTVQSLNYQQNDQRLLQQQKVEYLPNRSNQFPSTSTAITSHKLSQNSLSPNKISSSSSACREYIIAMNLTDYQKEHFEQKTSASIVETTAFTTTATIFDGINFNLGRWDARRLYRYFDFTVVGDKFLELSEDYTVCLATQSSLDRLYSLVEVANHWHGPISLAIFIANPNELNLLQIYLLYLRKCFPVIRDEVTVHLAFPKNYADTNVPAANNAHVWMSVEAWNNLKRKRRKPLDNRNFSCAKPESTLYDLLDYRTSETIKWHTRFEYPQNHMRNLARKGCQTDNVFLTDIDIIPSINFAEHLDKFLRTTRCTKAQNLCAYVIPTYELDNHVKFPRDKSDLLGLVRKGMARPFHQKVFIFNQYATNFTRWEEDKNLDDTHVSYDVTNFEFLYEPFYVSKDVAPMHDERFLGYGFTRNTQVYEMFVAGYQFQVLSPIFTCHWGMQNKKNRPAWRERQNNVNRRHLEVFKREVFAKYNKDPLKMMKPKKIERKFGA